VWNSVSHPEGGKRLKVLDKRLMRELLEPVKEERTQYTILHNK
jgi:hypothetical protein